MVSVARARLGVCYTPLRVGEVMTRRIRVLTLTAGRVGRRLTPLSANRVVGASEWHPRSHSVRLAIIVTMWRVKMAGLLSMI